MPNTTEIEAIREERADRMTDVAILAAEVLALAKASITEPSDAPFDLNEDDIPYLRHMLVERAQALHDAV